MYKYIYTTQNNTIPIMIIIIAQYNNNTMIIMRYTFLYYCNRNYIHGGLFKLCIPNQKHIGDTKSPIHGFLNDSHIPSSQLTYCSYGKSQPLIGKSTTDWQFSVANCNKLPGGNNEK